MATETPATIGPYTVVGRLDRSGPEPLYQATDSAGRSVVVRLYPPRESADLQEFRRGVLEKAVTLRHPALVRYEATGTHEGQVFAAMELVPGAQSLSRPLPLRNAVRLMRQMAEGLAYLHQHGVAHGCLNPSRVLVTAGGTAVKLTEPGMSTATRPAALEATASMQVARHAHYMAPELLRSAAPDARSDIYSFGVMFYEVLTGKLPAGRFRLPSQESDEVPPELDEVVLRCLRQDAAARYATAKDVVAAIDGASENLPGGLGHHLDTLTSTVLRSGPSQGGRRWLSWAALGAIVVVAGALLALRACG
ncbi:MAG: serine/threonine-protein kinase [Acidobacteriota bacterium]|jgi:serine/threonine-protein kinase